VTTRSPFGRIVRRTGPLSPSEMDVTRTGGA
jgi:hypothetical protein